MGNEIKVMSFNMRIATKVDGDNCFENRRPRIQAMLQKENPDVIGFQEVNDVMQDWLEETLSDYVIIGHGREAGYNGEGTPIAYKKNRFRLHAFREEWLSLDTRCPNSKIRGLDQSGCPRVLCLAELVDRESGKLFTFCNTHFDHKGKMAQIAECALVFLRICESGLPYVMMGDLNATAESASVQMIQATDRLLNTVDATANITGTFHAYSRERIEEGRLSKIDHIFTNMAVDPARSYSVTDGNDDGNFYSDHNAVCAFVSFAEEAEQ